MSCNNKNKFTCGEPKAYAECIEYQGTVSLNSALVNVGCLDVQEVDQDQYAMIDAIKAEIDLSGLVDDCIIFTPPKKVKTVIPQIVQKLCALQATVNAQAILITTMQAQILALQTNKCP